MATVQTPPAPSARPQQAPKTLKAPEARPVLLEVAPALPAEEDDGSGGDYFALLFLVFCFLILGLMNLVDPIWGLLFR
jgi:hypothetical protein